MPANQDVHRTTIERVSCLFTGVYVRSIDVCPGVGVPHPKIGFAYGLLRVGKSVIGSRVRGFYFPTLRNDPAKPNFLNDFSDLARKARKWSLSLAVKPNKISDLGPSSPELSSLIESVTYAQLGEFTNDFSYLEPHRNVAKIGKIRYVSY